MGWLGTCVGLTHTRCPGRAFHSIPFSPTAPPRRAEAPDLGFLCSCDWHLVTSLLPAHHPQCNPRNCLFPLILPVKAPTFPGLPQRLAPQIPTPSSTRCSLRVPGAPHAPCLGLPATTHLGAFGAPVPLCTFDTTGWNVIVLEGNSTCHSHSHMSIPPAPRLLSNSTRLPPCQTLSGCRPRG